MNVVSHIRFSINFRFRTLCFIVITCMASDSHNVSLRKFLLKECLEYVTVIRAGDHLYMAMVHSLVNYVVTMIYSTTYGTRNLMDKCFVI